MIRSLFLAIIVISCSPYPALGASLRAEAELDKWLENLSHPDPFISKRAEAEVRNLGEDALLPLAEILAKVPEKDALPERLQWLRVDGIVREILADFLSHLESEYSALELDRQDKRKGHQDLASQGFVGKDQSFRLVQCGPGTPVSHDDQRVAYLP